MKLLERARLLQELTLLPADADLAAVVAGAESGEVDAEVAPATALLVAAGVVLTVGPDDLSKAEDIPAIIRRFQAFCGNIFKVTDIKVESLGVVELDSKDMLGDDPDLGEEFTVEEETIGVTMTIDGKVYESEVTRLDDMIDLGFVNDLQDHLDEMGETRQICQLVEWMEDDPRFLFADPAKVEEAESREIITAPDFEDED
ncbi:hypothetical protein GC173_00860 [bacterium]|nr:hypothetical protein [bacterium]